MIGFQHSQLLRLLVLMQRSIAYLCFRAIRGGQQRRSDGGERGHRALVHFVSQVGCIREGRKKSGWPSGRWTSNCQWLDDIPTKNINTNYY